MSGALFWQAGIEAGWPILLSAISAGQQLDVYLTTFPGHLVKWSQALGYRRYTDLATTERQTHFRYQSNAGRQWWVEVLKVCKTSELGERE